jgi:DNA-binding response OmpR family regulator
MEQGKKQEKKKYPEFPVLVVDDDKNFLNSIEYSLLSKGITNLERCEDSGEVMSRLKEKVYSVILLDMIMPGINGMELLPKITNEYPGSPVIVLTGYPDRIKSFSCMNLGAYGYLTKTTDTNELITMIHNALILKDDQEFEKINNFEEIDEVEFKTTIHFHTKPPEIFSLMEEEQEEEKKFLESFFQLRKVIIIDIERISKNGTDKKIIELKGMEGLTFCYLAYKNYKALKNPEYRNWKEIPETYEFRLSGKPQKNKRQIPEWNVFFEYLERNDRDPEEGTIRQWILSLNSTLEEKEIKGIIDTSVGGRGKGYLLKGRVEFHPIE